ncbi:MAG: beta-N-acetylglucosaminidase domain-containing protein [Planctomycetia bacterium]|nr:beta-N-acetylglucosaminidase domain-containing protein [Planctomycetia bacterium]
MSQASPPPFLAGVIEGFYGPPWSPAERAELLEWMSAGRLNTYLYAPKDDLKHRAAWRELYEPSETAPLTAMIRGCRERGIRFIYALSPGLDIRFNEPAELERILARFDQLLALGCDDFALLFDDIPDQMRSEDRERFDTFAAAQCHIANAAFRWLRERRPNARFLFCPTPYCGRMAERQLGGAGYLETIGRELDEAIDICWTGPEIIAREITVEHARTLQSRLRRKPLIWDNLHANDYDGRRMYLGPYAGRPAALRIEVAGILCNPNTEFPLNYVPLRTFADYVEAPDNWDPRAAYLAAMQEWLPRFATHKGPATSEDLLLFGDSYYLPYEAGTEAATLRRFAEDFIINNQPDAGAEFLERGARLRNFCAALTDLSDRPLFYALHRRAWELREELDLLLGYVRAKQADPSATFHSDFHLPRTYRGGLVAQLQRLLALQPDGSFFPANAASPSHLPRRDEN